MEHTPVTPSDAHGGRKRFLVICLLLVLAVGIVYAPALTHDFVAFDDDVYVTENRYVKNGFVQGSLAWAFSFSHNNWHPLTWLSLTLDGELFGPNPTGYHLVNLLFHVLSTLILFIVLNRMTGALLPSAFVAALFALHPINVESVAWIAERKNVLSTFFWMLTLLAYERFARRPDLPRYLLVFSSLALGLMAKPMLVTLPFVLLLMDYWPLGRTRLWRPDNGDASDQGFQPAPFSRLVLEKIPLLLLSALSIAISCLAAEKTGGFVDAIPMGLRLSNAVTSYGVYLWKTLWPQGLGVFYPFPESVPLWKVAGAGGLVVALTALFLGTARKRPYLLVGWLWYLGTLIPVLGIVQHGLWPATADRYAYIPLVGLFMAVAFGAAEISKAAVFSNRPLKNAVFFGATGLVLMALMICSWQQLRYWRGTRALFERAIAVTEDNWVARYNLGTALEKRGDYQGAVANLKEAVRIKPTFAKAHYNLGCGLDGQGKHEQAVHHYREAVRVRPNYVEAYNNLGISLAILGRMSEAREAFLGALKINPKDVPARKNLQMLLRRSTGKP